MLKELYNISVNTLYNTDNTKQEFTTISSCVLVISCVLYGPQNNMMRYLSRFHCCRAVHSLHCYRHPTSVPHEILHLRDEHQLAAHVRLRSKCVYIFWKSESFILSLSTMTHYWYAFIENTRVRDSFPHTHFHISKYSSLCLSLTFPNQYNPTITPILLSLPTITTLLI